MPVAPARNRAAAGETTSPLDTFAAEWGYPSPRAAMRAACMDLLSATGQDAGPIALQPMLARLGARREDARLRTRGRLEVAGDGWRVLVRTGTPWRTARFTVAHEIGHILLYSTLAHKPDAVRALGHERHWAEVERLCDYCAAELLMPQHHVAAFARRVGVAPAGLRALYDKFLVSWEATLRRTAGVFGASLVLWQRYRRHPGERETLRVLVPTTDRTMWLPPGLTARHLRPDVVATADGDGFAHAERCVLALGERTPRRAAIAATSIVAAREAVASPPTLDGVPAPPDPPRLPFAVATFAKPCADEEWRCMVDAST
jgi:hypothetical protein